MEKRESKFSQQKRKMMPRYQRPMIRFQMPKDANIDYKNLGLLQKFLNERGKIVPRRVSGVSADAQRELSMAIKQARYLALLPSGATRTMK